MIVDEQKKKYTWGNEVNLNITKKKRSASKPAIGISLCEGLKKNLHLPAAHMQVPSIGEQRALFLQLHFCLHPWPKVSIGQGRAQVRTSQPGLQEQEPVCGSQLQKEF